MSRAQDLIKKHEGTFDKLAPKSEGHIIKERKKSGMVIITVSHPDFKDAFKLDFHGAKEREKAKEYGVWLDKVAATAAKKK